MKGLLPYLLGGLLRVGLRWCPPALEYLSKSIIFITPPTSFSQLQEGVFLNSIGSDPYHGNASSWSLPLLHPIAHFSDPFWLLLVIDLLTGFVYSRIGVAWDTSFGASFPPSVTSPANDTTDSASQESALPPNQCEIAAQQSGSPDANESSGRREAPRDSKPSGDEATELRSGGSGCDEGEEADGHRAVAAGCVNSSERIGFGGPLIESMAMVHLLSPLAASACAVNSLAVLYNFVTCLAILACARALPSLSMVLIAVAAACDMYPVALLPALVLARTSQKKVSGGWGFVKDVLVFFCAAYALLIASWRLSGSWEFLGGVYGNRILLTDLSPNIGLFWYFFIEIFDQFYSFFLFVFHTNVALACTALAVIFPRHPPLLITLTLIALAALKSYPSLADISLCLPFIVYHSRLLFSSRMWIVVLFGYTFALVLSVLFWRLWVDTDSGNANFFYAANITLAISNSFLLSELAYAGCTLKFESTHPPALFYEETAKSGRSISGACQLDHGTCATSSS